MKVMGHCVFSPLNRGEVLYVVLSSQHFHVPGSTIVHIINVMTGTY